MVTETEGRYSWGLDERTALGLAMLTSWLDWLGIPYTVTSGYRSPERQAELYAARASNPYPVAKPGTSRHEKRQAFDLDFPLDYWPFVEYLAPFAGLAWGGRFTRPDPIHFELA